LISSVVVDKFQELLGGPVSSYPSTAYATPALPAYSPSPAPAAVSRAVAYSDVPLASLSENSSKAESVITPEMSSTSYSTPQLAAYTSDSSPGAADSASSDPKLTADTLPEAAKYHTPVRDKGVPEEEEEKRMVKPEKEVKEELMASVKKVIEARKSDSYLYEADHQVLSYSA
jgi:hypothetical protein